MIPSDLSGGDVNEHELRRTNLNSPFLHSEELRGSDHLLARSHVNFNTLSLRVRPMRLKSTVSAPHVHRASFASSRSNTVIQGWRDL